MSEYINVPVPAELVPAVYKFLATAQNVSNTTQTDDDHREWTREQLQMLASAKVSSVRSFCRVLDLLAEFSPQPMTIQEIGEELGEEGLTLQRRFGGVTKWTRARIDSEINWPIHFCSDNRWYMNEHNATLWKEVTNG